MHPSDKYLDELKSMRKEQDLDPRMYKVFLADKDGNYTKLDIEKIVLDYGQVVIIVR